MKLSEENFRQNTIKKRRKALLEGRVKTTTTVAKKLHKLAIENYIPLSVALDRGITEILQKTNTQQRLTVLEAENARLKKALQLNVNLVHELQEKVEKVQKLD